MANDIETVIPLIKECHCGHPADKYRVRTFTNVAGYTINRAFYRCRNCWSRIHEDFCPEVANMKMAGVLDLLKTFGK